VQPLEKQSPKWTKKNTGKKAAVSNAINKATLLGIVLARKLVFTPPEPPTPRKLPVSFQKPPLKRLLLPV